jgi:UDP-N-acetylglucosamine 3-dehydrogenase
MDSAVRAAFNTEEHRFDGLVVESPEVLSANASPVRIAVVGCGSMGYNHARVLARLPCAELVAIVDTDFKRAKAVAEEFSCSAYGSVPELLLATDIDAATVAVPTRFHRSVGVDLLRHGIATLVEKPLAPTSQEAHDLIETAESSGVALAVGHVERYNPAVVALKRLIDEGTLGSIISVVARRVGIAPAADKSCGVLVDLAIHDVDVLNYLLGGPPSQGTASIGAAILDACVDYGDLFFRYGLVGAFVQANWLTPVKIRSLQVTGTAAYAELDYVSQELALVDACEVSDRVGDGGGSSGVGVRRRRAIEVVRDEPLRVELEAFLRHVRGQPGPIVTGREGMEALRAIEMATGPRQVVYA